MDEVAAFIRKVRFCEFYARSIWPLHRILVRRHFSRRCRRCILSEKYAPLTEGVCDACREPARAPPQGPGATAESQETEREYHRLIRSYEKAGTGWYDALVLFSGGKDSVLLIHKLRHEFPRLRLLARGWT